MKRGNSIEKKERRGKRTEERGKVNRKLKRNEEKKNRKGKNQILTLETPI